jgi:DNA (cytosine-5)-methyltransferase 1
MRDSNIDEIVIDSFAGGGGASTGIEAALRAIGAEPGVVDIAINHNGAALAMHAANHPCTLHLAADIWTVDPLATTKGRPVGLLWGSPDCRHFSKAKGGAPVSDSVRGLAWTLAHWAEQVRPRLIFLENVEEFATWGPTITGPKGHLIADPDRVGETFRQWAARFKKLGYRVECRVLRACDFGAPTIRKRLYIIMRRDGEKIAWPKPTHGDPKSAAVRKGKRLPWRTAAEIIDWNRPCPSILMSRDEARAYTAATGTRVVRPLADNTMARIAAGVKRYVLEAAEPFIVTCNHSGNGFRGQGLAEPFVTVTKARDAHGLVMPLLSAYYGSDQDTPVSDPLHTVTTKDRFGLIQVSAHHIMTMRNAGKPYSAADEPTHTVTAGGAGLTVVSAFMIAHYGNDVGASIDRPVRTLTGIPKIEPVTCEGAIPPLSEEQIARAHQVADFLRAHGAWDDREFVTVGDYIVVDIGMRMLTPRELARAQGFPEDYVLAAPFNGGVLSESDQRHKIGNSVCPPVAAALVAANYQPRVASVERADQGWLFETEAA